MSENTETWTLGALKTYLEQRISDNDRRYLELFERQTSSSGQVLSAQREAVNAALAAADRAVQKAEIASEKRFDAVNEFRSTLADQQRNLIPRSEVVLSIAALTEKLDGCIKQVDALQAERRGVQGGWGYAVGVIGFVLAITSVIVLFINLNHKL